MAGMRLKIGTYIIDAAESSSTSTTTGCKLLADSSRGREAEPLGLEWEEASDRAVVTFSVHVVRDTVANLLTSRDALANAINQGSGDVVIESESGTTLKTFALSTGLYTSMNGQCTIRDGELDCLIEATITLERSLQAMVGGTDMVENPTGLVDAVRWRATRDTQGRLNIEVGAQFKDTTGPSVTARVNANVWIAALRALTSKPDFLPAADYLRVVNDNVDFTIADTAAASSGIATATVQLRETPDGLSALTPRIRDVGYLIDVRPLQIDQRGGTPGSLITLTASLYTKTHGNVTYDTSDTEPVDLTDEEADTAIGIIKTQALARIGTIGGTSPIEISREKSRSHGGDILCTIIFYHEGSGVIDWQEEVRHNATDGAAIVTDCKGKDRVYPDAGKGVEMVFHALSVRSVTGIPSYIAPSLSGTFRVVDSNATDPKSLLFKGSSRPIYERTFAKIYRRINTAAGGLSNAGGDVGTLEDLG